jgi:uncharacterized protein YjbI with pentapeptide repeats
MITVTIHRTTLEHHRACAEGLALYDAIAALQPESNCITIAEWTPLHSIWPYVAGYGAFARWLEARGIIPRVDFSGANLSCANLYGAVLSCANLSRAVLSCANLRGANLYVADLSGANLHGADLFRANLSGAYLHGAYRGSSSPIPGWRTNEFGFLEREEVTRAAE